MRIVGGEFRGRSLATPKGSAIRPTSDRLRESLFNVLAHAYDDRVTGARVLDLCAGTGALGLEALSRGAAHAVFVDESAEARGLIRETIDAFGLGGRTRVFRRDATKLGPVGTLDPFTLAFMDPPYRRGLPTLILASLRSGGWLSEGALVIVEEAADAPFEHPGFEALETREAGVTRLTFLRRGS